MKRKHLLYLMLIILMTIPLVSISMSGWGQALFDIQTIKQEPSRLFPILSATDIIGAPDEAIPIEAIKKIYDRCKSRVPNRFPPEAHENYCTCAAAATQGTVTVGELRELQKDTARKLGNATFEKYVKNVMKSCMEQPIDDVEYYFCISARDIDWRIHLPVPYCKCVSRDIREHFKVFGLEEMMIPWGNPKKQSTSDPTDTLWDSDNFLKARNVAKQSCAGRYMDSEYFK